MRACLSSIGPHLHSFPPIGPHLHSCPPIDPHLYSCPPIGPHLHSCPPIGPQVREMKQKEWRRLDTDGKRPTVRTHFEVTEDPVFGYIKDLPERDPTAPPAGLAPLWANKYHEINNEEEPRIVAIRYDCSALVWLLE